MQGENDKAKNLDLYGNFSFLDYCYFFAPYYCGSCPLGEFLGCSMGD